MVDLTTPKWAQSNRLWQALSLILGLLLLREKFDFRERVDVGQPVVTDNAKGHDRSANATAPSLCSCSTMHVVDADANATPALALPSAAAERRPPARRPPAKAEGRRLASVNDGNDNSSNLSHDAHGGHSGEHHAHPHVALFYLLTSIIIGTIVLHLMTLPLFHGVQQTVVLFILGLIHSAIFEALDISDDVFGESHNMWMRIDPHLLLFTMLPALLTGDAITIDTSIARKVGYQCIYLAGPGVLMGAFGIAGFLYWYFQWDFLLCLCTGSILSATDPVAVVGLLKELGASPTLTVQIQGESLLNDGTAIVLYLLAYDSISGVSYDAGEIIVFLVKMALSAVALGVVIGYVFLLWIRLSCKRLEHHTNLIQTTLTICCAYTSFCLSEGLLHISGVLCTVASSLVLADKMWPSIVEKEGLHQVWHMLEYLGNTIIFFLAGGLTGKVLVTIQWRDLLDLFLLYLVATFVRGAILFGSRPILGYLSETRTPVSMQDAAVMTWGGLRGAVGLALAVQVNIGRINENITEDQANKVLFFVAGMACLTLLINATTSPALVRSLGVTRTPKAKQQILFKIHGQMKRLEMTTDNPRVVHKAMEELLEQAHHHVDSLVKGTVVKRSSSLVPEAIQKGVWALSKKAKGKVCRQAKAIVPSVHVNELLDAKKAYNKIARSRIKLLAVPHMQGESYDQQLCKAAIPDEESVEAIMVVAYNEALLLLVRSHYWHLIDSGEFVDGSTDAEVLLHSVRLAIDTSEQGMKDLHHLKKHLHLVQDRVVPEPGGRASSESAPRASHELKATASTTSDRPSRKRINSSRNSARGSTGTTTSEPSVNDSNHITGIVRGTSIGRILLVDFEKDKTPLMRFTESLPFNIFMGSMIIFNVAYIGIEQAEVAVSHGVTWGLELFFVTIFCLEFLVKLVAWRCSYFTEAWNVFDFVLVVIGVIGLIFLGMMQGMEEGNTENDMSQEARMFRINRVFRVLRIIRVFRLMNFARLLMAKFMKKEFSLQLSEQLQSITVLKAFIKAHMHAQAKMLEYFGNEGAADTCEVAICLLQSQGQVYRALTLAAKELEYIDPSIIKNVNIGRKVFTCAHHLSDFVLQAHHDGVISARMAETILEPVRNHMRVIDRMLTEVQSGVRGRGHLKLMEEPDRPLPQVEGEGDGFYDSDEDGEKAPTGENDEGSEEAMPGEASPCVTAEVPCMPVRLGRATKNSDDSETKSHVHFQPV